MDAHRDDKGIHSPALFEHMLKIFDNTWYAKRFITIFQKLHTQNAKGDGKRKQAKMTDLVALSKQRLEEAEDLVETRKKRKVGPPKATKNRKIRDKRTDAKLLQST